MVRVAEHRQSLVADETESPARWGWAVLAVVITAIVFGAVTYVVSATLSPHYTVSAKVLVQPDATLSDPSPTLSSLDQNNIYLQSQVQAVQSLPSGGSADVTVTQVGLTNVLQITADSTSARSAVATANQVLQAYLTLRQNQVSAYAATAAREIDSQLAKDDAALASLHGSSPQVLAERSAVSTDYSRLLSLKHQVMLTASVAQPTTVLHRAQLSDATKSTSKTRNAALAALVGALLAVAVTVALRRRSVGSSVESDERLLAEARAL